MIEELLPILKVVILLSWFSVLFTLSLKIIIKKKVKKEVPEMPEKKIEKIDLKKLIKMKGYFLTLKRILRASIIFISLYVCLKFVLDISNIITLILVPGILIPALITMEIYISIAEDLLKKVGDLKSKMKGENYEETRSNISVHS